jgi:hypothetical protein
MRFPFSFTCFSPSGVVMMSHPLVLLFRARAPATAPVEPPRSAPATMRPPVARLPSEPSSIISAPHSEAGHFLNALVTLPRRRPYSPTEQLKVLLSLYSWALLQMLLWCCWMILESFPYFTGEAF